MSKKNRYSIKRNYTKRRRKTKNNFINKRRKTQKKHNKRKKTNMKGGGDGGEPKPYPNPNPNPIPIPPDPSPKPEPEQSLKLISRFEDIQSQKLYILSGSDDFLYMYTDKKKYDSPYERAEIEESIDELDEKNDPKDWCEIRMNRSILDYFEGAECDGYIRSPLFYRIDYFNNPNYLCATSGQWGRGGRVTRASPPDLFEASFNYINSIYNIYEIDEWPKSLPPPPIRKSKEKNKEECSGDYIKQNKNKIECNQNCCGWPHSGYVCGEVDSLPGTEGKCTLEEKTSTKQNPTY